MFGMIYTYKGSCGHEIKTADRLGSYWIVCSCGETFAGDDEFDWHNMKTKGERHTEVSREFELEEEYPCNECGDLVEIKPLQLSYASWMSHYVGSEEEEKSDVEKREPVAPAEPVLNEQANGMVQIVKELGLLPLKVQETLEDPEMMARLTLVDGQLSIGPTGRKNTPTSRALKEAYPEFPVVGNLHESW